MAISKEDAQQFLDAINDYISNGDMEIAAISPEKAGRMSRAQMNDFLFDLFAEVLSLKE